MSKRHMPAHDQLPRELRLMLHDLDFNFNAENVLALHRMGYGTAHIRRVLEDIQLRKHRADADAGQVMRQR